MKKIRSFVGIVLVLLVFLLIKMEFTKGISKNVLEKKVSSSLSQSKKDFHNELINGFNEGAKELNQSAPTMVDEQTRFDKATVGPGPVLNYYFTLLNYASDELDREWVNSELRKSITSNVCNDDEIKLPLQYGGMYNYSYSGNDEKVITSFYVTRADCSITPVNP